MYKNWLPPIFLKAKHKPQTLRGSSVSCQITKHTKYPTYDQAEGKVDLHLPRLIKLEMYSISPLFMKVYFIRYYE